MMVPTFGDGAFGPDYKLGIQNVLPTSQHQIVRLHSCGSISTLYSLKLFVCLVFFFGDSSRDFTSNLDCYFGENFNWKNTFF